jgi:predicted transcriptional regulator
MTRKKNVPGERLVNRLNSELELLRRHLAMLKMIKLNEPVGIIKLAELTKNPQHKVRYSLRVLEQEGLIKPTIAGAVTTHKLKNFLSALKVVSSKAERSITGLKKAIEEFEAS